jgi:sulfite reductase (NADPH) flavoprotein alpha-component
MCLLYVLRAARHVPKGDVVVTNDFWMPAVLPWLSGKAGKVVVNANRFPKKQYRLYGKAAAFAEASSAVADAIERESPACRAKTEVLPNAVDSAFLASISTEQKRATVQILYVGRVHPEKGLRLLADALREDFDITALSKVVLKKLAEATGSAMLGELLAEDANDKLRAYIEGREIIDALIDFAPNGLSAEALTGIFRKLPIRLYSIASSLLAHPEEVHLTVAAVRYETHGRSRKGVCSTYLSDVAKTGTNVAVFVQPNKNFRLPADGGTPIIMVGPGTGVAPFRAFVEHRAALGSTGKNWLFFGDQRYTYDFLYQLEWQDFLKNGQLTKLDLAFSRDQPEKVYVQDKMVEKGAELYAWLEEGAHFYVCGDANRMAADVHEALISIVENFGSKSREEAEAYVENLKKAKRYQRDVY